MKARREVLWSGTVRPSSIEERIDAAAANGYRALSLSPMDYARAGENPARARELSRIAADRGVAITILDGIATWYPFPPPRRPAPVLDFDTERVFAIAEAFGTSFLSAIPMFDAPLDVDALAEHFARLCDGAAGRGIRVQLEPIPFPPVRDLATGWEIVRRANRPNGGLVLDTWHFFKGRPDFDVLASIPGERVFGVQVSDGLLANVQSLVQDTFRHRRQPGSGEFDLLRFLRTIETTGAVANFGPEILSVDREAREPADAARAAAASIDRLLASTD